MANISEILEKYKDSRTMEAAVYNAFYEAARRYAESRIHKDFKSSFSGSDVANRALKSALSELVHGRISNATSDGFRRLLFVIVQRKVNDQIRHHDQAMRSPRKKVSLDPNLTPSQTCTDPTVKAVLDELSANAVVKLLQRHDGDGKNPLRLYIAAMGTLYDIKAGDILSALKESFPASEVPARRTIEKQRKEDREFFFGWIRDQMTSTDD
jgi:DNA-directed RNA polymerase specialized sigma24 family protein